ncbi:MAG: hypothetical protein IK040_07455 [Spirochaetia bacterium]|nr:hypothetical protein [Spirochaetia bacterium]
MKKKFVFLISLLFIATMLFAQSSNNSVTVYVTENGKKYHTAYCHTIKNSKTIFMKEEDAIKAGYNACKICNPQIKANSPKKEASSKR